MTRKKLRLLVLGLLIGVLGLATIKLTRSWSLGQEEKILSSTIDENVETILDLATIKYNYSNLADYENSLEISGLSIPFTNKSFLVKYDGYLKAGFSQVDVSLEDENRLVIKLGQARILDNVINEEDVYFYNEKDSAFNRLKFDELYQVLNQEKLKVEEEAIERGILNEADKNARLLLTSFFKSLGFDNLEFK